MPPRNSTKEIAANRISQINFANQDGVGMIAIPDARPDYYKDVLRTKKSYKEIEKNLELRKKELETVRMKNSK